MIAYASSKAFLNTFGTSLRALACTTANHANGINEHNAKTHATVDGIEVTTVASGFIELPMGDGPRERRLRSSSADRTARKVVNAVERGGEGLCVPDAMEGLLIYALKGAVVSYFLR